MEGEREGSTGFCVKEAPRIKEETKTLSHVIIRGARGGSGLMGSLERCLCSFHSFFFPVIQKYSAEISEQLII